MQGRISKCGKFLIHNDHIHEVLGKVIIGYSRKIHMKGGAKSRWVAQINACIHMTTMSFGIWQLGFWIARDWDMIQNTFELHSFQIHFERFIQCDHWHINHKCGVKWSLCMYVCMWILWLWLVVSTINSHKGLSSTKWVEWSLTSFLSLKYDEGDWSKRAKSSKETLNFHFDA